MHLPTERTAHTTAFDGALVDHWLEQKIAQMANTRARVAVVFPPLLIISFVIYEYEYILLI